MAGEKVDMFGGRRRQRHKEVFRVAAERARHQLLLQPRSPRAAETDALLHAIEGGGGMDSVEADSRMR